MLVSEDVPDVIDHLDGNGLNNNPLNLRKSSPTDNMKNLSMCVLNKSGVTGVHWSPIRNKWVAAGSLDGKTVPLGRYVNKQDAIDIRLKWEQDNNFTKRHGK